MGRGGGPDRILHAAVHGPVLLRRLHGGHRRRRPGDRGRCLRVRRPLRHRLPVRGGARRLRLHRRPRRLGPDHGGPRVPARDPVRLQLVCRRLLDGGHGDLGRGPGLRRGQRLPGVHQRRRLAGLPGAGAGFRGRLARVRQRAVGHVPERELRGADRGGGHLGAVRVQRRHTGRHGPLPHRGGELPGPGLRGVRRGPGLRGVRGVGSARRRLDDSPRQLPRQRGSRPVPARVLRIQLHPLPAPGYPGHPGADVRR